VSTFALGSRVLSPVENWVITHCGHDAGLQSPWDERRLGFLGQCLGMMERRRTPAATPAQSGVLKGLCSTRTTEMATNNKQWTKCILCVPVVFTWLVKKHPSIYPGCKAMWQNHDMYLAYAAVCTALQGSVHGPYIYNSLTQLSWNFTYSSVLGNIMLVLPCGWFLKKMF
jgi:hypothetical protein